MAQAAKNEASAPTCPFCHNQVSGELIAYGGQCPFCFGEIPGEETPTDPGEHKKAQHDKEFHQEAKKVGNSRVLPVLLVCMIVLVPTVTAAALWLRPATPLPTLNLDDETFDFSTGALAYVQPDEKVDSKKPVANPGKPPPKADPNAFIAGKPFEPGNGGKIGDNIKTGPDAADAGMTIRKPGTVESVAMQGMSSANAANGPSMSGLDIETTVGRKFQAGVTLTDDDQIVDMAKAVVKQNQPRLRPCVERKLKLDPDFRGKWNLTFTVTTKGQVERVAAEGRDRHDAEFEECLVGYVKGWQFQPIKAPLPITKLLTFGGG